MSTQAGEGSKEAGLHAEIEALRRDVAGLLVKSLTKLRRPGKE
jgi:hypothetical protein